MFRSGAVKTLEDHQTCATPAGVFIPEQALNLRRTRALGTTSTRPSPTPLHPPLWEV